VRISDQQGRASIYEKSELARLYSLRLYTLLAFPSTSLATMPNLHPITPSRHANRRWRGYTSYAFAATDSITPLVAQELPKALMALPTGFIAHNNSYLPVAVLGLQPGKNLFVALDGRWLADYLPAVYRGVPFALASTEDGKQILCVDEDSGLVSDTEGVPFFGEDGQPSQAVKDTLNFLTQVAQNRLATQAICALLQKHCLFQPWPIKVHADAGEQNIEGLFRIDEAALNQLTADALMELRNSGALLLAFCQLLSMQHLPKLGQLAQAHAQAAQRTAALIHPPSGELDLEFLNDGGTLRFGNF